jgi:MFS family permease
MKPSPYRWIVLIVFMLVTITIEIQWLTHAAVMRPAEVFYRGQYNQDSIFNIDFLAMSYMLFFMLMSFPASYIIGKLGIKKSLSLGAVVSAIAAIGKAVFAASFMGVVIFQVFLALAQPFIINAVTAVTVRWFPFSERAMAGGLLALAQYLGIIVAMLVTPLMIGINPDLPDYGSGFGKMLWIYGIITALSSAALVLFIKEYPDGYSPECEEVRKPFGEGVLHILKNRDSRITLMLFFIGLGIFNAVSSMTDSISEHAGVKDSDGLVGGLMLIGGIIGALILPALSDKFRKRKIFMVVCIAGMIPGVAGLAYAGSFGLGPTYTYSVLLTSAFTLGFFVMSAGPIGFQYAAEVNYPAPESASQGMMLWTGQLSGMLFVAGMSARHNEHLSSFMHLFAGLAVNCFILVLFLRESPAVSSENN